RDDARAVGTVQATVTEGGRLAEVAWVIGTPWQSLPGEDAPLGVSALPRPRRPPRPPPRSRPPTPRPPPTPRT
ncbi:hypothetical protein ACFWPM_36425, partial [Streptomyces sp. NPDC058479]